MSGTLKPKDVTMRFPVLQEASSAAIVGPNDIRSKETIETSFFDVEGDILDVLLVENLHQPGHRSNSRIDLEDSLEFNFTSLHFISIRTCDSTQPS